MNTIFCVHNQVITRTDTNVIVADSRNYLQATFIFSEEWNGKEKTAIFIHDDKAYHVLLENDKCLVPWEVIKPGFLSVSVFAGDLITTNACVTSIKDSGYTDGTKPSDPTPTIYEQIMQKLDEIQTGTVDPNEIAKAVEEYLATHPVETLTEEDVQRIVSEYVTAHKGELKGDKGEKGDKGDTGPAGPQGPQGIQGLQGIQGEKGDTGATGPEGPTGAQGDPGADGVTPNLTIGTVETLPSGSDATATITGDKENPVLNLGIPKGADGLKGTDGISPTAAVTKSDNKSTLTVTDRNGTTSVDILDGISIHYEEQYHDINVIPDKYNTGCDESALTDSSDGAYIDLNSSGWNMVTEDVIYENINYWNVATGIYNGWGYKGTGFTITYNNCKFKEWKMPYEGVNVNVVFNNCSFMSMINAFNVTFNNCFFGHFDASVTGDACNPIKNCFVNSCYIADVVVSTETQGSDHIDGTQIRNGSNNTFTNCRWECPDINYTYKQGQVSYAVFIQDSTECVFNRCHINGGGHYSISITSDGNKIDSPYVGQNFVTNVFYPNEYSKQCTKNPDLYNSLYVTSVWKDLNKRLHFLVSNDTRVERKLVVLTNLGITEYTIPKTMLPSEYDADTKKFEDFPFDLEKIIESDVDYAVFFEEGRQIRFVNFTDYPILNNSTEVTVRTYVNSQIGGALNDSY